MYLQTHETNIGAGTQMRLEMGTDSGRDSETNATEAKALLQQALGEAQSLADYRFSSGKQIGDFVFDFYCESLNLVIAVDPSSDIVNLHREQFLKERRMSFLRFEAEQVSCKTDTVLSTIAWFISRYEKLNRLGSLSTPRPAMAIAC